MATGYTRVSAGTILTGNTIQASDFNGEYNLLESAFSAATGHNHDGTVGGGAKISVAALGTLTSTSAGIIVADGASGYVVRTLTAPAAGITITNGSGVSGNPTLVLANDLAGLEGLSGTGVAVRTGTSTWTNRTITAGSNISITNGDGVSGNPTVAVSGIGSSIQAYDATLAALAAYNTNGLIAQTAADTFAGRTLTGTAGRIAIANGDGVSGNPILNIDPSYVGQNTITTLGTITTGVWTGTTVAIANGGTGATTANGAFNALAPSQAAANGKFLTSNGSDTSWAATLADPGSNGLIVRTAANVTTARSLASGTNITVTNPDGIAGNPSIALSGQVAVANGGTGLSSVGTSGNVLTSDGSLWVSSALPASVTSVATSGGVTGGTITSTGTISIDTNNSLGVGSYALLRNNSGGATVNNGSTAAGSALLLVYFDNVGVYQTATAPSGTWRNVSGRNLVFSGSGESGLFIRTA